MQPSRHRVLDPRRRPGPATRCRAFLVADTGGVRLRTGAPCSLCVSGTSTPTGEHVWPRWFLKRFPASEGPYTLQINGEPQTDRDGKPVSHSSIARVKLPMCEACNRKLNDRFEQTAKPVVRRVFDTNGGIVLSPRDATAFSLWFLKTMLLLAHPQAVHSQLGGPMLPWADDTDGDIYAWLVAGRAPPDHLSMWVTRRGSGSIPVQDATRLPLPRVHSDGQMYRTQHKHVGLEPFDFHLLHHPRWPLDHPLMRSGSALQLHPMLPGGLQLASLPPADDSSVRFVHGPEVSFADRWLSDHGWPTLDEHIRFSVGEMPGLVMAGYGGD